MKFVSMDDEVKRVAHTSGVIEMIGKEPVELPVEVYPGLQACAMAAGCIPFGSKRPADTLAAAGKDAAKINESAIATAKEIVDNALAEAARIVKEATEKVAGNQELVSLGAPGLEEEPVAPAAPVSPVSPAAPAEAKAAPVAAPVAKGKIV